MARPSLPQTTLARRRTAVCQRLYLRVWVAHTLAAVSVRVRGRVGALTPEDAVLTVEGGCGQMDDQRCVRLEHDVELVVVARRAAATREGRGNMPGGGGSERAG